MNLRLLNGDCVKRMREMESNSIDSIICDPPYGLKFMGKGWDNMGEGSSQRKWHEEWLKEAFRVLKSGGVIKAFSGTRTFHHLMGAMENVGFDDLRLEAWNYGSGFPKSLNISKAIDKAAGAEREVVGTQIGVGGENVNDLVRGSRIVRTHKDDGGKGVGAYGTGARQVRIEIPITAAATPEAHTWQGWGTALKPAWEPICIGRKP